MEAIKELLKTIPEPWEIAEMSDDELRNLISWNIEISTKVANVSFTVNLSVGSNFADVRKFARAVSELVDIDNENGKITLKINVFENIEKVLYDLLMSDEISPALKAELFELTGYSVGEICDYICDSERFTYDKYLAVIKAIDYEAILENFGIEDISNEKLIGILSANRSIFEKLVNKVLPLFDYAPEVLKNKSVFDLYDENGTFSYSNAIEVSIGDIIAKAESGSAFRLAAQLSAHGGTHRGAEGRTGSRRCAA